VSSHLVMSNRARAARLATDEDAVRTVAHASLIVARYREKGHSGKALAARLVRHARLLSALDPAIAVELIERANAIDAEARQR